jgi:hypothetical protein
MGTIIPLTLPSGSNPTRYPQGGNEELINCYREDLGPEAKSGFAIYGSDGLQGFATLQGSNGKVRALLNVDGVLYVVAGTQLHTVTTSGIDTLIGSMNIDTSAPVYMQRNRRSTPDILIVCDGLAYYSRAGVLTQVTDVDLLAPLSMTFNDGYFVISTVANQFQSGVLDDASNWAALAYSRADANPDAIVTLSTLQQDILVIGEKTIEIHRDVGDNPFPYERVAVIQWGCSAAGSVTTVNGTVAFLAHDGTVRMLDGYEAVRISTISQELDIAKLADKSVLRSTSWIRNGHAFYMLTCSSFTWVCDLNTSPPRWHRRRTYMATNWNISAIESFDNKLIAGDATSGLLYEMSPDFFDDAGTTIESRVQFAPLHAFPYRMTINEIFFDAQVGVGSGQGDDQDVNPEIMLEVSRDSGITFGQQRTLSLGAQGANLTRVRSQRFGQYTEKGAVVALQWSCKVARAIYEVSADVNRDQP